MSFVRTVYSECYKLIASRGWWIVFGLVIMLQPLFAFIGAGQTAAVGLDATPATHPELIAAFPPLDYLGFDACLFGMLPMVIFGGIFGASEYKNHHLRTTLLSSNKRGELLTAKLFAFLIATVLVSFISIFVTIAITHIGLGDLGLNPLTLSPIAWQFIGYTVIYWTLLAVLAFSLGLLFRNMIIPLVFLMPQIYNLGNFLAEKWSWGEYLPVAAGNFLIATPVDAFSHAPLKGTIIIALWLGVTLTIALYAFMKSDVGGKY
jgi:ABC-type transport system involved in multi-copper enzyme maturation permease subunit